MACAHVERVPVRRPWLQLPALRAVWQGRWQPASDRRNPAGFADQLLEPAQEQEPVQEQERPLQQVQVLLRQLALAQLLPLEQEQEQGQGQLAARVR